MASSARKEKRNQELVKTGRRAEEIDAERRASDVALAKALETIEAKDQEIHDLLAKVAQGTEALEKGAAVLGSLRFCSDHLADAAGADCVLCLAEDRGQQIVQLSTELVEARVTLTRLEAEDKDAVKLRRRLATAKADLAARNSELAKLKRPEVF